LPSSVVLHFNNWAKAEVHFVVGSDGIHSAARKSLELKGGLIYRRYLVWRGMTCRSNGKDSQQLGLQQDGDFSESYGYGKRFGIVRLGANRIHWYAVANKSLLHGSRSDATPLRTFSLPGTLQFPWCPFSVHTAEVKVDGTDIGEWTGGGIGCNLSRK
jgi:2-polyprenyl-6-methoxyphenol hydroxylase-like FAD-dependent oxidoreductase